MKQNNFFPQTSAFSNFFYVFSLITRSYFTDYMLLASNFGIPIILYVVLITVLPKEMSASGLAVGIGISGIMSTSILAFATSYFEWFRSIIYKKLRVSSVGKSQFIFSFFIFYLLTSILTFWVFVSLALLYERIFTEEPYIFVNQIRSIRAINWIWIFIAKIELISIGIAIGYLIAKFVPSFSGVMGVGLMIYLIFAFVTGCFIPLPLIAGKSAIINGTSWLPITGPVHMWQSAWLENYEILQIEINEATDEFGANLTEEKIWNFRAGEQAQPYTWTQIGGFGEANAGLRIASYQNLFRQYGDERYNMIVDLEASIKDDVRLFSTWKVEHGEWWDSVEESFQTRELYQIFSPLGNYWQHSLFGGAWAMSLGVVCILTDRFWKTE